MSAENMITPRSGTGSTPDSDRFIAWVLSTFAAFHVGLVLFMPGAAEKFMLGDRALDRTVKMQNLMSADRLDAFLSVLFRQSSPGDYILFAPAYALAGPTGVMLQNTALIFVGALFLYKLASLFFSGRVAALATVAYCLLPATLFHPHVFVSEGICNPLLIVTTYFLARFATADASRVSDLIIAGVLTAVLCFTRHVYLVMPLFFAAILLLARPRSNGATLREVATFLVLSFSLVLGWGVAEHYGTKRYGGGDSVGGLGSNMYLRGERMAAIGGFALPAAIDERARASNTDLRTMTPGEFIQVVNAHPGSYAKTVFSDTFNITANPGMAMYFGRFLGVFDLGEKTHEDYNKWREVRDKNGIAGVLTELWLTSPLGLVINAVGGLAWAGFLIVALFGAWKLVTDRLQSLVVKLLLVAMPVFLIGVTSLAAGYTRWDHRSPVEFAFAVLFALGFTSWLEARSRTRDL